MTIENMKLTYGHDYKQVIGTITFSDQRIEKLLASGQSLMLVPERKEDLHEGVKVIGITLLPIPAVPVVHRPNDLKPNA